MEKDDKIKSKSDKTRKYALTAVLSLVVLGAVYAIYFHNPPPAPALAAQGGKSTTRGMAQNIQATATKNNNQQQPPASNLAELEAQYKSLDEEVRAIKKTGVIMETDPESLKKTGELQEAAKKLLRAKYGDYPSYRVKVDLEFQPTIPDYAEKGKDGTIVIEMAPVDLIPVSVFTFLEEARTWIRGAFHRNAGHVLQVQAVSDVHKHLPFQEYSPKHPHKKGTTGYCGRPSGPCWYVSIMDNTRNHGPGSQQSKNPHEADANFGRVVEGFDDVVPRIHSVPQQGWLDEKNQIKIIKMTILIPDGSGGYMEWKDPFKTTS